MPDKPKKDNQNLDFSELANQTLDSAKNALEQGNARRVILRTSEGRQFIDVSLTVAIVVVALFTFLMPGGLLWVIAGVVIGAMLKLQVEVLRELDQKADRSIQINKDSDES
ncbi:hypothetical protein MASR2M15_01740 [Anaerolineales bacterium]